MNHQQWNPVHYQPTIYDYINEQNEKISRLEDLIKQMQLELNQLKSQPSSVTYKFDQLKVERLEGTLNIGLSPNHGNNDENPIEDFTVNQGNLDVPPNYPPALYQNIHSYVNDYLDSECYQTLASIEEKYNYQLDNPYRQFIINDIKNQIDGRIQHYLSKIQSDQSDEFQLKEIEGRIINKVKDDIHKTLDEYIRHLPKEGY